MNKLFYLLVVLIVSVQAQAADLSVSFGLNTTHIVFDTEISRAQIDACNRNCVIGEFYEDNKLVSIGYKSYEAFTMINSYKVRSYGVMKTNTGKFFHYRFGVVSGYRVNQYGVLGGDTADIMPFIAGGAHYDLTSNITFQTDLFTNAVITSVKLNF